jgi:hypothetical protein
VSNRILSPLRVVDPLEAGDCVEELSFSGFRPAADEIVQVVTDNFMMGATFQKPGSFRINSRAEIRKS